MIQRFDQALESFSKWGILVCLFIMILFSLGSITLRWFGLSYHWIDPAIRHFVFLSVFFGGSLATGSRKNIKIDLLSRIFESFGYQKTEKLLDQIVSVITLIIILILVKAGADFSKDELEYGKVLFWGLHSGALVSIIPFGFFLISLRLVLRICMALSHHDEKVKIHE